MYIYHALINALSAHILATVLATVPCFSQTLDTR